MARYADIGHLTTSRVLTEFFVYVGVTILVGRGVVIHELADDLGLGDSSEIGTQGRTSEVGRYRLTLSKPVLNADAYGLMTA
jgi:hypothetical protein